MSNIASTTSNFDTRFTAKESSSGTPPFIAIELGSGDKEVLKNKELCLRFRKPVDFDQAQAAARALNDQFKSLSVLSFP